MTTKQLARMLGAFFFGAAIAVCVDANAQTVAGPNSQFLADIQAPDVATAQNYIWRVYNDGAAMGVQLAPVTCVLPLGQSPPILVTCNMPIGAYTPGPHTVTLTASDSAGESNKSAPLVFTMIAVPNTPSAPRIK